VEAITQLIPSEPPEERLRLAHPDIWQHVSRTGDLELLELVTARVADQSKSTAKFLNFFATFRPPPPQRRPRTERLNWGNLVSQLKDIYNYRSKDLHEGSRFPEEMCLPAYVSSSGIAGEVAAVLNGRPQMSLQTFEYVVRKSVQQWWAMSRTDGGVA
jgi:hypothetical protein